MTGAGRLFLDEVRQALAQVQRAAQVAERAGRGELGHVVAGFIGSAANELTPLILRAFPARYPNVGVELREFDFRDPSAGLTSNEVDVAFKPPSSTLPGMAFLQLSGGSFRTASTLLV